VSQRREHLAVVDVEIKVDQEVALPGRGREAGAEVAIEVSRVGKGLEDPRIVVRRGGGEFADEMSWLSPSTKAAFAETTRDAGSQLRP
jgi:hypothetical protein